MKLIIIPWCLRAIRDSSGHYMIKTQLRVYQEGKKGYITLFWGVCSKEGFFGEYIK